MYNGHLTAVVNAGALTVHLVRRTNDCSTMVRLGAAGVVESSRSLWHASPDLPSFKRFVSHLERDGRRIFASGPGHDVQTPMVVAVVDALEHHARLRPNRRLAQEVTGAWKRDVPHRCMLHQAASVCETCCWTLRRESASATLANVWYWYEGAAHAICNMTQ